MIEFSLASVVLALWAACVMLCWWAVDKFAGRIARPPQEKPKEGYRRYDIDDTPASRTIDRLSDLVYFDYANRRRRSPGGVALGVCLALAISKARAANDIDACCSATLAFLWFKEIRGGGYYKARLGCNIGSLFDFERDARRAWARAKA